MISKSSSSPSPTSTSASSSSPVAFFYLASPRILVGILSRLWCRFLSWKPLCVLLLFVPRLGFLRRRTRAFFLCRVWGRSQAVKHVDTYTPFHLDKPRTTRTVSFPQLLESCYTHFWFHFCRSIISGFLLSRHEVFLCPIAQIYHPPYSTASSPPSPPSSTSLWDHDTN